jgi:hypothetical protein
MISLDKTYRTRDGKEVKLYAVHEGQNFPVHGAILIDGKWSATMWSVDGKWHPSGPSSELDLIEVKPKRTLDVWVNVYEGHTASHMTKKIADGCQLYNLLACIHIVQEYEEGEGL